MTEYLNFSEAAAFLGYTNATLALLRNNEVGPLRSARRPRYFEKEELAWWKKQFQWTPNEQMSCERDPMFARHDDGRWWVRMSYDEAMRHGLERYFEGTACERLHRCERSAADRRCVECARSVDRAK